MECAAPAALWIIAPTRLDIPPLVIVIIILILIAVITIKIRIKIMINTSNPPHTSRSRRIYEEDKGKRLGRKTKE